MTGAAIDHTRGVLAGTGVDLDLDLAIDLDQKTVSGTLTAPVALRKVAEKIGGTGQWVLEWVPELEFDSFGVGYNPNTKAFALEGTGGSVGAPKPQASLILGFVRTDAGARVWVVTIGLATSVDLGSVPVLGSLLSGTSIGPVGIEYATGDIPAKALPNPAPSDMAEVKPGMSLALTITAAGTTYPLVYNRPAAPAAPAPAPAAPAGGSGGTPAHAQALAAVAPPGPGPAPPGPGTSPFVWFDVDRSFGPLHVGRIGIESNETDMGFGFDASLALSTLKLGLTGFQLSVRKSDFTDFSLSIDGLDVSIDSPSVTLEGGLIRRPGDPAATPPTSDRYDGAIVMKIGAWSINAIGSFGEVNGAPSMFLFGVVLGKFGGPPAFFVTGLAAGFGYNRGLKIPTIDQVAEFPFVELASGGSDGKPPAVDDVLDQLDTGGWIPPEEGSYWLAAGIQATSFGIAKTFAVLTVEFGSDLVFAIIGTSQIKLPSPDAGPTYAEADLSIEAVLRPKEGTFQLTALLSPSSYVIDPACTLTGGFAFWLWFGDNPHAGDFVITLGGYNPHFTPPAWYPSVPRLGFSWHMSDDLQLTGGAYFAVTPSCAMAGGSLSLTYQSGGLSAWFDAYADFILWWRPFYYDIDIGISIGASYSTSVLGVSVTFSISLSADIELWGPEMAGVAHVHWWVIGFEVDINGGGAASPPGSVLKDWATFETTFLPAPDPAPKPPALRAAAAPAATPPAGVLSLRATGGLIGAVDGKDGKDWLMTASGFQLATQSAIPATVVEVCGPKDVCGPTGIAVEMTGPGVGVYPLAACPLAVKPPVDGFASTQTIAIVSASSGKTLDTSAWTWEPTVTGVPQSLWGIENDGSKPLSANTTPGLTGLTGTAHAVAPQGPGPFLLCRLGYEDHTLGLPLSTTLVDGSLAQDPGDSRAKVGPSGSGTVADPATQSARTALVAGLNAAYGAGALPDSGLSALAEKVDVALQWGPLIGPLGTSGAPAGTAARLGAAPLGPVSASAAATALPAGNAPRVRPVALFRRLARPEPAVPVGDGAAGGAAAGAAPAWRVPPRSRLLAHVADRQAAGSDRRVLHAALRGDGAVRLTPGATVAWHTEPGASLALHGDGALPLRLTAVDRGGAVLCDRPLAAGESLPVELPPGAAAVAVTCGANTPGAPVAGWHGESPLIQVGPSALLGEACVVRGQAPHRIPHRRRRGTRAVGATTGRALVDRCWTDGPAGRERGFLHTTLPPLTRTLVLSLRPDPAGTEPPGDPAAAAIVECAYGSERRHVELGLEDRVEDAEGTHLVYSLDPEDALEAHASGSFLRAVTRADGGWMQDGVLGFQAERHVVLDGSAAPRLEHAALGGLGEPAGTAVALR